MNVAQRAMGKGRQPWRIKEFLDEQGLIMADVARALKLPHNVVADTVRGIRNHRKVLAKLEELGCPKEILYGQQHAIKEAA